MPLHVLEMTSSALSTRPARVSWMVFLASARASSFRSSRMQANISVWSLFCRSKESVLLDSYPRTSSSSCLVGQTILPTYLFFFPWVNRGSRIFSNSRVPPSREYLSAISVPNSTDSSSVLPGDCTNTESVSEYTTLWPSDCSSPMIPLTFALANDVIAAPMLLSVNL